MPEQHEGRSHASARRKAARLARIAAELDLARGHVTAIGADNEMAGEQILAGVETVLGEVSGRLREFRPAAAPAGDGET